MREFNLQKEGQLDTTPLLSLTFIAIFLCYLLIISLCISFLHIEDNVKFKCGGRKILIFSLFFKLDNKFLGQLDLIFAYFNFYFLHLFSFSYQVQNWPKILRTHQVIHPQKESKGASAFTRDIEHTKDRFGLELIMESIKLFKYSLSPKVQFGQTTFLGHSQSHP